MSGVKTPSKNKTGIRRISGRQQAHPFALPYGALTPQITIEGHRLGHTLFMLLLAASLACTNACNREKPTTIRVSAGPSFILSGSGRLALFTVYAPRAGRRFAPPNPDVAAIMWQLKASKGYFEGSRVEGMQLTYSTVPAGYMQTVPTQPLQPQLPRPGAVYSFFAETTDAPAIGGYFYVGSTGVTEIAVPDLCLKLVNGREVSVKCGTNEPYEEPSDLEKFVEDHKIAH